MKDKSTKVGGRRSKAGSNETAGNSTGTPGKARSFSSSRTVGVAKQNKRFAKTRTRRGESNAIS